MRDISASAKSPRTQEKPGFDHPQPKRVALETRSSRVVVICPHRAIAECYREAIHRFMPGSSVDVHETATLEESPYLEVVEFEAGRPAPRFVVDHPTLVARVLKRIPNAAGVQRIRKRLLARAILRCMKTHPMPDWDLFRPWLLQSVDSVASEWDSAPDETAEIRSAHGLVRFTGYLDWCRENYIPHYTPNSSFTRMIDLGMTEDSRTPFDPESVRTEHSSSALLEDLRRIIEARDLGLSRLQVSP